VFFTTHCSHSNYVVVVTLKIREAHNAIVGILDKSLDGFTLEFRKPGSDFTQLVTNEMCQLVDVAVFD